MNRPPQKKYVPIIRTRDAEMRGFENLSSEVKSELLPIIEFTKSRRSKTNAEGRVERCVDRLHAAIGDQPYIADLTSLEAYQNTEITDCLDPKNSFENWCKFVERRLSANCIPVVHLTDPLDKNTVSEQAKRLIDKSGCVALRLPTDYDSASSLADIMDDAIGSLKKVVLVLDAGFIVRARVTAIAAAANSLLASFGSRVGLAAIASSGFPSSVVLPGYGSDAYGKFELPEVALSRALAKLPHGTAAVHGDYGLIHPVDFAGVVTNWVPRVDVPLADSTYYYRYRRDDGGYIKAAAEALDDESYVSLDCWAHRNIVDAAGGAPQGRSPAHWIAVRVNYHITRQTHRLTA